MPDPSWLDPPSQAGENRTWAATDGARFRQVAVRAAQLLKQCPAIRPARSFRLVREKPRGDRLARESGPFPLQPDTQGARLPRRAELERMPSRFETHAPGTDFLAIDPQCPGRVLEAVLARTGNQDSPAELDVRTRGKRRKTLARPQIQVWPRTFQHDSGALGNESRRSVKSTRSGDYRRSEEHQQVRAHR